MSSAFKVVEGPHKGKSVSYKSDCVWLGDRRIPYEEITELELVDSQVVKKSDSALFGTIGFLVGGPIGAAAGAGLGGLSRPCTFLITLTHGEVVPATGWRMHFNKMSARHKIVTALQGKS